MYEIAVYRNDLVTGRLKQSLVAGLSRFRPVRPYGTRSYNIGMTFLQTKLHVTKNIRLLFRRFLSPLESDIATSF